ncbi:hypothetical protein CTheo_7765 [Ceratobasidium theobromae]|uniref:Transmembrane protein n=1 Tax=Ceratobasidium theobromae TaxID=1582974 RepID=A0A5N5QAJ1_9AGAM|nr:hypothetical protein CTheo_7765 [Ceratobasidium theobromae]
MTRLNIPLFIALAASILSAVDARNTLPHQRMIRRRTPIGPDVALWPRQADPTNSLVASTTAAGSSTSAAATPTRSSSSSAAAPTQSSTSSTSSSTPVASSTSSGGLLDTLTGALLSTTSSTVSSTSSSSSSTSTSTSSSTTSTSSTPQPTSQQQQPTTSSTPPLNIASTTSTPANVPASTSISLVTTVAPAAAASESAAAKAKTAKITRNTIISLVVVASCIGGAIAIWTVIRKWKLSPSERFDDRMQPIDWTPPNGTHEDSIEEKSKHRRAGSGASHGSFTSAAMGPSEQGHGAKGSVYNDSQHGHGYGAQPQDFPPAHDFTAGAMQPGGYGQYYGGQQYAGAPGYANLQRGPSVSESTYSHGASVARGLSYSRAHGAYEAQPGAGAVPPLPNPYGGEYGYEDYNHQAGQQQQQQVQAQGQGQYRAY